MDHKIKVFLDYPISKDNSYKGLSFPHVLFNYLKKLDSVELVSIKDKIDVCIVISGGSHYEQSNSNIFEKVFHHFFKPSANFLLKRNVAYEKRIKKLKDQNPNMKIIHRLDDRYRILCKLYGYDKTVRNINAMADMTIFQSLYGQSLYMNEINTIFGKESPLPIKNHQIINNGVDTKTFSPEGDTINLKGEIKILHAAATGMVRKGLGTVLDIAEVLKDNENIQFYLIGRQDTDPIHGHKIKNFKNVTHLPFTTDRKELAKIYRSCDLFLFPSKNDCAPNVIIEAMSCGLAVVALESGGSTEIIRKEDMQGGLFIQPKNPVYSVKEVIENLQSFRESALNIIEKYHDIEVIGPQYLSVIKKVVSN
jgi:glycosyltransferase involved in cell wall biosynthesis